jgi:hypothetical protein
MTEQSTAATQTTDAAVDTATSATTTALTDAAATKTDATTQAAATDAAKTESGMVDEGKKDGDKPATGAPEKYEFTVPDGLKVDATAQTEFEGIARELGLNQDGANKLYAMGAKMVQAQQQAYETAIETQSQQWAEAAKTDKEIGGEKFDASMTVARNALAKYASPELRTLLEQTRLGNHPEVLRLFHRIGSTIADDTLVNAPSAGGSDRRTVASVLYDHPTSKSQR